MVEQVSHKNLVIGSIPIQPTNFQRLTIVDNVLDFNHPVYFPCECNKCKWQGMSNLLKGGAEQLSGEHDDLLCPVCDSNDIIELM